jgi:anti-anti-sigma factor
MSEFELEVKRLDNCAVIRSNGYINNLGGEKIAIECRKLIQDEYRNIILNLERSPVVNSIGISILIEIIESILSKNGRLSFCHLTPTIAKTFRIMGLFQFSEFFSDESSAIKAITQKA